jgi:hypothetical protein
MGDSSIIVTLDRYGHLLPGNEAQAAECSTTTSASTTMAAQQ